MKKQFLTLTICLALTATSALAIGINPLKQSKELKDNTPTVVKPQVEQPQAQNFFKPGNQPNIISKEEAKKRFEERKAKERELLYSAINLSIEQKAKAEELDAKTRAEAGKYLKKVHTETKKLRELKTKKASFLAIYKQKLALSAAKKEAHKYFEASRKDFEAILTKEQLAKLKSIEAAKKEEMKQFKKQHKFDVIKKFKSKKPMGPKKSMESELMESPPPSGKSNN